VAARLTIIVNFEKFIFLMSFDFSVVYQQNLDHGSLACVLILERLVGFSVTQFRIFYCVNRGASDQVFTWMDTGRKDPHWQWHLRDN
jgi:hypothetical protein